MDMDGNGVLSLYELEYFYEEQMQRLDTWAIEPFPFLDPVCQMRNLLKSRIPGARDARGWVLCSVGSMGTTLSFSVSSPVSV